MSNVFEELNKLYEDASENLPSLLDIVRCSTVVVVDDARNFTHDEAEQIAAQFNYEDDVDFEEEYDSAAGTAVLDPLAGRSPEKFTVSIDEVREVINKIASNHINLITRLNTPNGRKNVEFMDQLQLTEDDVRELMRQLRTGDYSYSAESRNINRTGNILTFFITKKDFTLADGRTFNDLQVYVKVDATRDGLVTAVSFHRGTGSIQHPYEGQD